MTQLLEWISFTDSGVMTSTRWLRLANLLCLVAAISGVFEVRVHWRAFRGSGKLGGLMTRLPFWSLLGAFVATGVSVWNRYVEVNHFPSQTMGEVLVMFSWGLLVSMIVLRFALQFRRMGPGWAILDDALMISVVLGAFATNAYTSTLSTAQRDLPPALQSYWFPPHLVALIFSYATLGIAGILSLKFFCVRFWLASSHGLSLRSMTVGVLSLLGLSSWLYVRTFAEEPNTTLLGLLLLAGLIGLVVYVVAALRSLTGAERIRHVIVLGALSFVPFAHFATLPVLALSGLIFLHLRFRDRLPSLASLAGFEKVLDQNSYRAFAVGIPFLTAGLFMGAFWAQEAWANYWGWDSKENSALITWLVYVVYIHLRMLGGYTGEKAMAVLMGGALSVLVTFQLFGYLPDSQKSLHRYTDDGVVPREGMQGTRASSDAAASLERARADPAEGR